MFWSLLSMNRPSSVAYTSPPYSFFSAEFKNELHYWDLFFFTKIIQSFTLVNNTTIVLLSKLIAGHL